MQLRDSSQKFPMLPLKEFDKFGEFEIFRQILDTEKISLITSEDFFIPKKV